MSVNNIQSTSYANSFPQNSSTKSSSQLQIEDFLKLITAQMQNQDMYNAMDSTETISQMAQMTSLSQMEELRSSVNTSLSLSFMGKTATARTISASGKEQITSGVVDGVTFSEGEPYIQIAGQYFKLGEIIQVANSAPSTDNGGTWE